MVKEEAFNIDPSFLKIWQEKGMEEKRYDYPLKPTDLILDIGAYQGSWSKIMHDLYGCKSILFEPVRVPALDSIRDNENFQIIEAAAWIFNDRLKFGGNGYWTSHFIDGIQEYPCVDINNYLNCEIAVCKINIEGGEYDLIQHIINGDLQTHIRNFQIQFHNWNHECIFQRHKIQTQLAKTHRMTWGVSWCWENWELC